MSRPTRPPSEPRPVRAFSRSWPTGHAPSNAPCASSTRVRHGGERPCCGAAPHRSASRRVARARCSAGRQEAASRRCSIWRSSHRACNAFP
ncbi:Hypothetical protein SCLAV_p1512 (plasmid) [Streptomyces clavuligerus]|uniref:Uncharacterized protein n=1 Tax=Streptomyces clavuligerus TaxID=1901 RepID=D5SM51_STRCL|nr:Hypothetical protein SCLAV_p1512 [Streptomyces clavuligerus]